MKREEFMTLNEDDQRAALLDEASDAVRSLAKQLAMIKAITHVENGIDPEAFDKAWTREYGKAWDRVKDKTGDQLAVIGLLDMMSSGADVEVILGGK